MAIQTKKARFPRLLRIFETPQLPEGEVQTLRWLFVMRYRIGFLLLVVVIVCSLANLVREESSLGLLAVNLVYLVATAIYDLILRGEVGERFAPLIRGVQMPEKIILCTLALYFFGGALTPLFILYPLAILESIILVDPNGVYRTGALAVLAYSTLALLESVGVLPQFGGFQGQPLPPTGNVIVYAVFTLIISSILMLTTYLGNRVALLIQQRNSRIDSQVRDLRALYDIANALGNIMDEDEILRYLASTLKSLEQASMCIIAVLDREGHLEIKAGIGARPEMLQKLRGASISSMPALSAVFERGEPIVMEDVSKFPEYSSLSVHPSTVSLYVYPLRVESKVLGGVGLSFDKLRPMTPAYHDLMTAVASQAGLALERARLVNSARRMAAEMTSLYDVGLQTGSTLSKDEIIKRTAGNIEKLLNPDAYYIALYDPESEMISFEIFNEKGQIMPKMRASMQNGGLTGHILRTGKPLLIQDWLEHGDTYNAIAKKTGLDVLSYLGVPMESVDKVVGVISVQCVEPMSFDSHDERLLMALAAQTAMALENAKLHQVAQDQAQFDSLTRVYNHGNFVDLVRKAVADSDADDSQVALIMLDIDHFKQYNDTYGHVAGDNVLRMVANALKSSVRETDFVGRWGGEEFGVLLTGAGVTEAKKVARIIRRAISELYPVDGQGHLIPNPTVSQGVSSYPYPSATASYLIEQADAALYHAKEHGRNQLVIFEASHSMREATITTGKLARHRKDIEDSVISTSPLRARDPSQVTTDELSRQDTDCDVVTSPQLS